MICFINAYIRSVWMQLLSIVDVHVEMQVV